MSALCRLSSLRRSRAARRRNPAEISVEGRPLWLRRMSRRSRAFVLDGEQHTFASNSEKALNTQLAWSEWPTDTLYRVYITTVALYNVLLYILSYISVVPLEGIHRAMAGQRCSWPV